MEGNRKLPSPESEQQPGDETRAAALVVVPADMLSQEALNGLIEEFVTRDGTDYGEREDALEQKKNAVVRQLEREEILIVFDPESETANIVPKEVVGYLSRRRYDLDVAP